MLLIRLQQPSRLRLLLLQRNQMNNMEKCKQLLENSIECYEALLAHAQAFSIVISDGPIHIEKINHYNEKLEKLQHKVETVDTELMSRLQDQADTFISDALMDKRTSKIKELQDYNDKLLPRLISMMDITRDELSRLRKNMGNISGYHSGKTQSTGTIVRNHC